MIYSCVAIIANFLDTDPNAMPTRAPKTVRILYILLRVESVESYMSSKRNEELQCVRRGMCAREREIEINPVWWCMSLFE